MDSYYRVEEEEQRQTQSELETWDNIISQELHPPKEKIHLINTNTIINKFFCAAADIIGEVQNRQKRSIVRSISRHRLMMVVVQNGERGKGKPA